WLTGELCVALSPISWQRELQKDAEKRKRYAPVLEFFNSLPDRQGWSLIQFNFTVGVRGSFSSEDRTDAL
ncbi:MAG: hypothetical protein ACK55Z_08370, partial [bacterium]